MSILSLKSMEFDSTPAAIDFDYLSFKAELDAHLESYRTLVTVDTVKEAKATATEINKLINDLDDRRKTAIKFVSAPIKTADDNMKSCIQMAKDDRQAILDQVARFESVRLDELRTELTGRRDRLRIDAKLQTEFYGAASDISDLVKLAGMTATGRATNKVCQSVSDRVNQELALQQNVDRRLLELENASYKAGLAVPLTRVHVEGFLQASEEAYTAKLDQLITAEIARDRQAREAMERKAQQQADAKVAAAQAEMADKQRIEEQSRQADEAARIEQQAANEPQQVEPWESQPEPQAQKPQPQVQAPAPRVKPIAREGSESPAASETYSLTVTMTATLPAGMSLSDIRQQFRAFIESPGNVQVDFLSVDKEQGAA